MELSTYFRINAANTANLNERLSLPTMIRMFSHHGRLLRLPCVMRNQLHAAMVEIIVHDRAEVKYNYGTKLVSGDAEAKAVFITSLPNAAIAKEQAVNFRGHK